MMSSEGVINQSQQPTNGFTQDLFSPLQFCEVVQGSQQQNVAVVSSRGLVHSAAVSPVTTLVTSAVQPQQHAQHQMTQQQLSLHSHKPLQSFPHPTSLLPPHPSSLTHHVQSSSTSISPLHHHPHHLHHQIQLQQLHHHQQLQQPSPHQLHHHTHHQTAAAHHIHQQHLYHQQQLHQQQHQMQLHQQHIHQQQQQMNNSNLINANSSGQLTLIHDKQNRNTLQKSNGHKSKKANNNLKSTSKQSVHGLSNNNKQSNNISQSNSISHAHKKQNEQHKVQHISPTLQINSQSVNKIPPQNNQSNNINTRNIQMSANSNTIILKQCNVTDLSTVSNKNIVLNNNSLSLVDGKVMTMSMTDSCNKSNKIKTSVSATNSSNSISNCNLTAIKPDPSPKLNNNLTTALTNNVADESNNQSKDLSLNMNNSPVPLIQLMPTISTQPLITSCTGEIMQISPLQTISYTPIDQSIVVAQPISANIESDLEVVKSGSPQTTATLTLLSPVSTGNNSTSPTARVLTGSSSLNLKQNNLMAIGSTSYPTTVVTKFPIFLSTVAKTNTHELEKSTTVVNNNFSNKLNYKSQNSNDNKGMPQRPKMRSVCIGTDDEFFLQNSVLTVSTNTSQSISSNTSSNISFNIKNNKQVKVNVIPLNKGTPNKQILPIYARQNTSLNITQPTKLINNKENCAALVTINETANVNHDANTNNVRTVIYITPSNNNSISDVVQQQNESMKEDEITIIAINSPSSNASQIVTKKIPPPNPVIPIKKTWRRPWKKKKEREKKKKPAKKVRRSKPRRKIVYHRTQVLQIDSRNGPPIDTEKNVVSRPAEENIDSLKQKRQRIKLNRNSGREYINRLGKVVEARKVGKPCNCPMKCWDRMGSKVVVIFNSFWDLCDFNLQNSYLFTCLKLRDVTRRYTKKPAEESRRQNTFEYFVRICGKHVRVCKRAFMSVHGLTSDKRLRTLLSQMKDGALLPLYDRRGKHLRPLKGGSEELLSVNSISNKNKKVRVSSNNSSGTSKRRSSSKNLSHDNANTLSSLTSKTMFTAPHQMVPLHSHCPPPTPSSSLHPHPAQDPPHTYIPNGELYFPGHYLEQSQNMGHLNINQIPPCQKMLEAPAYFMAGMKENTFHQ